MKNKINMKLALSKALLLFFLIVVSVTLETAHIILFGVLNLWAFWNGAMIYGCIMIGKSNWWKERAIP